MKICPKCKTSYSDDELYFCQNDGEQLAVINQNPKPAVFADSTRITNQNWDSYQQPPNWQNQQLSAIPKFEGQYTSIKKNQTLGTASLVLGILSILLMCCWGIGFPIGIAAFVTGYLGYNKVETDPTNYGGQGLAISGMVIGAISSLITIGFIILMIFS
jgi:hypothetical protein